MSTELYCSNIHSHSNTVFINASLSKMHNKASERGESLLKKLMRKKIQTHENAVESKSFKNSNKKPPISPKNKDAKELLKENKCKSTNTHSNKKMCYCSPTTHEGSFRCRLHRINATNKSTTKKNSVMRCSKFKPHLSRFGRVAASTEVGSHDSSMQSSELESS